MSLTHTGVFSSHVLPGTPSPGRMHVEVLTSANLSCSGALPCQMRLCSMQEPSDLGIQTSP